MPNPKTGTVTNDIAKAVADVKGGRIEYRADRTGILHLIIGKKSFEERALLENLPDLVPAGVVARGHTPDTFLQGDETLELAGITFETLQVPGHSPAHLAFHADECLFSGDVLFAGSVGRTDLPGADWETLVDSIRTLSQRFPPETTVYPGHGPPTTLGVELERNPFLAPLRAS